MADIAGRETMSEYSIFVSVSLFSTRIDVLVTIGRSRKEAKKQRGRNEKEKKEKRAHRPVEMDTDKLKSVSSIYLTAWVLTMIVVVWLRENQLCLSIYTDTFTVMVCGREAQGPRGCSEKVVKVTGSMRVWSLDKVLPTFLELV